MASITLTIPAAAAARIETAIINIFGYSAVLANGSPNPQTKAEFVKAWIATTLKNEVKEYEGAIASNIAIAASNSNVDANILIT